MYNVELVNCVLCDDGDELFLFYDLAVCEMNNSNLQSKGVFCVLLCWVFFFKPCRSNKEVYCLYTRLFMSISFQELKLKLVILHRILNPEAWE